MTPGQRCDEIIRLIDEVLTDRTEQPGSRTVRSPYAPSTSPYSGAARRPTPRRPAKAV